MKLLHNIMSFDVYRSINEDLSGRSQRTSDEIFAKKGELHLNSGAVVNARDIVDVVRQAVEDINVNWNSFYNFAKSATIFYTYNNTDCKTMYVNKSLEIHVSANFVYETLKMDSNLVEAVLMHEIFHIIYNHIKRGENWLSANGKRLTPQTHMDNNLAADVEVNRTLVKKYIISESDLVNVIHGIYLRSDSHNVASMEDILEDEEAMKKLRSMVDYPQEQQRGGQQGGNQGNQQGGNQGNQQGGESGGQQGGQGGGESNGQQGENQGNQQGGQGGQGGEQSSNNAQNAADEAQQAADAAQKASNDAQKASENGSEEQKNASQKAQQKANDAQKAADKARKKAEEAEEAKANGDKDLEKQATKDAKKASEEARNALNDAKKAAKEAGANIDDNSNENNSSNGSSNGSSNSSSNGSGNGNSNGGDKGIADNKDFNSEVSSIIGEFDDSINNKLSKQIIANDKTYTKEEKQQLEEIRKKTEITNSPTAMEKKKREYVNSLSDKDIVKQILKKSLADSKKFEDLWKKILEKFLESRHRPGNDKNSNNWNWVNKHRLSNHMYGVNIPKEAEEDPQDINVYVDVSGSMDVDLMTIICNSLITFCNSFEYSGMNIVPWASKSGGIYSIESISKKGKDQVVKEIIGILENAPKYCDYGTDAKATIDSIVGVCVESLNKPNKITKDDVHIIITDGYISGLETFEKDLYNSIKAETNKEVAENALLNTIWMIYDNEDKKGIESCLKVGKKIFISSEMVKKAGHK